MGVIDRSNAIRHLDLRGNNVESEVKSLSAALRWKLMPQMLLVVHASASVDSKWDIACISMGGQCVTKVCVDPSNTKLAELRKMIAHRFLHPEQKINLLLPE